MARTITNLTHKKSTSRDVGGCGGRISTTSLKFIGILSQPLKWIPSFINVSS